MSIVSAAAIDTPRLRLRSWSDADKAPFIRDTNNESVMRWLGGVKAPELLAAMIDKFRNWEAERGFTFWAVERKEDGALLGFCGLKRADDEGTKILGEMEIGWRLREEDWGKGYAKEAAMACLDFAFERAGAGRVVALTVVENAPSWGLMQRLGMSRREEYDYTGPDWADGPVIVYVAERDEWRS